MIHPNFCSCELFSEYQIPATHLRSLGLKAEQSRAEKRVAQGDFGAFVCVNRGHQEGIVSEGSFNTGG